MERFSFALQIDLPHTLLEVSWASEKACKKSSRELMNRTDLATIRAMFDAFVDPIILLDEQANILQFNRSARERFGENHIGQPAQTILNSPYILAAIEHAMKGEVSEAAEVLLPDSIDYTYNAHVVPLFFSNAPGSPRVMVTLHDITDVRRSEQLRVDFLSNASHELKTPLASLLGFIETLQGPAKNDPEAHERFLAIMHAQASRMTRLVQDLLSLARIEFNEHVTPTGRVDIGALAKQSIVQLEKRAADRRVALRLHIPKELPLVFGDSDQLIQLLQNLIDNAIKYTTEGTPIDITLLPEGKKVHILVRDHGPGIDRQHLARLTERFYRIDSGRSRSMGGTGLGLSIVKHIVNRHRGTLLIESEMGKGSTFSVHLPIAV